MIVGIVHAYYLASSRKFPDPCALELATPFNTHFAQCSAASLERAKRKPSRSIYYGTQLAANADLPLDSLILSLLKNKPIAAVELSIGAYKYRVKVNTRYSLPFKGVRQIFLAHGCLGINLYPDSFDLFILVDRERGCAIVNDSGESALFLLRVQLMSSEKHSIISQTAEKMSQLRYPALFLFSQIFTCWHLLPSFVAFTQSQLVGF